MRIIRLWYFFVMIIGILLIIYKRNPYLRLIVHNILEYVISQCSVHNQGNEEKTKYKDISAANAKHQISLKSYIWSEQNVHPKVLYFENGFCGYKFWMAYTPYPWFIDRFENPCIAFSDDGFNWTNINGNPIDDAKGNGYYSDTHLVYREDKGALECWYRYIGDHRKLPVSEILYKRVSTDGISWSEKEMIYENKTGYYAQFLSPSVIWNKNQYEIWVVNHANDCRIEHYIYNEGRQLEKIRAYDIEFSISGEGSKKLYKPWHIDVIRENGATIFLVMCKAIGNFRTRRWDLFITQTEDDISFSNPYLVIHGSSNGWDNSIYRSSIVRVENEYRIYYSALNTRGRHGIGITKSDHLGNFIGV